MRRLPLGPTRWLLLTLVGLTLLAPASARAANAVIADCSAHNELTGHYSVTQLRGALSTLPADVKEYTACYDVIQRQLLVQLGKVKGTGNGGGGGSFLPAWLIVVLVLLILAGAVYAGLALRRQRLGEPPAD